MSEEKHHVMSSTSLVMVLVGLLILTIATVAITNVNLGPFSVTAALLIATAKATLVLLFFMHLRFDHPILRISVSVVLIVFFLVIIFTFFDYLFR